MPFLNHGLSYIELSHLEAPSPKKSYGRWTGYSQICWFFYGADNSDDRRGRSTIESEVLARRVELGVSAKSVNKSRNVFRSLSLSSTPLVCPLPLLQLLTVSTKSSGARPNSDERGARLDRDELF